MAPKQNVEQMSGGYAEAVLAGFSEQKDHVKGGQNKGLLSANFLGVPTLVAGLALMLFQSVFTAYSVLNKRPLRAEGLSRRTVSTKPKTYNGKPIKVITGLMAQREAALSKQPFRLRISALLFKLFFLP